MGLRPTHVDKNRIDPGELTFKGVHPRSSLPEPTKAHAKENPDGPVGESKPLRMGVQIPRIIHPKIASGLGHMPRRLVNDD